MQSLRKAQNIQGRDLREYDVVLDTNMYAITGGLFSVVLQQKLYPLSWCELQNDSWNQEVIKKSSGISIEDEAWFIKQGTLKQIWTLV